MRGFDISRNLADSTVLAVLSGILLGTSAFFLKITMSGELSRAVIFSPFAWLALLLAIIGFLLMQKSFQGYVSKAIPIINGFMIIFSVALAFVFLGESIPVIKWFGILLVLAGIFGMVGANEKKK